MTSVDHHSAQRPVPWRTPDVEWETVTVTPDLNHTTAAFKRVFGDAYDPSQRSTLQDSKVKPDGDLVVGFGDHALDPEILVGAIVVVCWDQSGSSGTISPPAGPPCPDLR